MYFANKGFLQKQKPKGQNVGTSRGSKECSQPGIPTCVVISIPHRAHRTHEPIEPMSTGIGPEVLDLTPGSFFRPAYRLPA
jgi:hypothetical protein